MRLHLREHETGLRPRIRIWTDEMQGYGQFEIMDNDDAQNLKQLLDKLRIVTFIEHHCDGSAECKCRRLTYGERIGDALPRKHITIPVNPGV